MLFSVADEWIQRKQLSRQQQIHSLLQQRVITLAASSDAYRSRKSNIPALRCQSRTRGNCTVLICLGSACCSLLALIHYQLCKQLPSPLAQIRALLTIALWLLWPRGDVFLRLTDPGQAPFHCILIYATIKLIHQGLKVEREWKNIKEVTVLDKHLVTDLHRGCSAFWSAETAVSGEISISTSSVKDISLCKQQNLNAEGYGSSREKLQLFDCEGLTSKSDIYHWCCRLLSVSIKLHNPFHVLTHDAGLAQAGDGLSVVPSGLWRGGAGAGDALRVRHRRTFLQGVQQRGPDLVVRCWTGGVIPARSMKKNYFLLSPQPLCPGT